MQILREIDCKRLYKRVVQQICLLLMLSRESEEGKVLSEFGCAAAQKRWRGAQCAVDRQMA